MMRAAEARQTERVVPLERCRESSRAEATAHWLGKGFGGMSMVRLYCHVRVNATHAVVSECAAHRRCRRDDHTSGSSLLTDFYIHTL